MLIALQVVRWSLCFLAFYAASLVYEDEEGAVQNRLEEWWLRLAYKKEAQLSGAARFIRGVARLADRVFDGILGEGLWSFQAVGVSIWFSLASLWIALLVASHVRRIVPHPGPSLIHLWFYVAICVLFGMLPVLLGRLWAFSVWTLV